MVTTLLDLRASLKTTPYSGQILDNEHF